MPAIDAIAGTVNPDPRVTASKGQARRKPQRAARRRHEDAMHTTTQHYLSRNRAAFRPLAALAAVAATAATLSLAVITPATLPHTDPDRDALAAARQAPVVTEVAIVPASIEVVAKRTRNARGRQPLPAGRVPAARVGAMQDHTGRSRGDRRLPPAGRARRARGQVESLRPSRCSTAATFAFSRPAGPLR